MADDKSLLVREDDSPEDAGPIITTSPPASILKPPQDLTYMNRPPRIVPNYGKKQRSSGALPKSSISRVLLYDNVTQQQMLDVKMSHLLSEERKTGRLLDLHRKSFIVRHKQKQKKWASKLVHVNHSLPGLSVPTNTVLAANNARPAFHSARGTSVDNDDLDQDTVGSRKRNIFRKKVLDDELKAVQKGHDGEVKVSQTGQDGEVKGLQLNYQKAVVLPPLINHQRFGASTSFGFAVPAPENRAAAQRSSQTAMMYRERERLPSATTTTTTFPDIHSGALAGGKVMLRVDSDRHGLTRLLHTFQARDRWQSKVKGKGKRRGDRTTEDERYRKLERVLVRVEPPNEGYLEHSPSFHSPRQLMTFTRPSSIHSSIFCKRSSASSIRKRPVIINS